MNGLTEDEHKALLRSVGTHRRYRPLSPLEVGLLLKRAIQAGSTREQCSEQLNLGRTIVASFIKLPNLAPEIQHLAAWGRSTNASISFSSLAQLTRLHQRRDQINIADAVLRYSLTSNEVVQIVQLAERSIMPATQCVREVLRLRPQIQSRHLFVGSLRNHDLRLYLANLNQIERDRLFNCALDSVFLHRTSVSGRLGTKYFTILSSENLPSLLCVESDALEKTLTDVLDQSIQAATSK